MTVKETDMIKADYVYLCDRDDLRHAVSEALACLILVGFLAVTFFFVRGV